MFVSSPLEVGVTMRIYLLVLEEPNELKPKASIAFAPFALPTSQAIVGGPIL